MPIKGGLQPFLWAKEKGGEKNKRRVREEEKAREWEKQEKREKQGQKIKKKRERGNHKNCRSFINFGLKASSWSRVRWPKSCQKALFCFPKKGANLSFFLFFIFSIFILLISFSLQICDSVLSLNFVIDVLLLLRRKICCWF